MYQAFEFKLKNFKHLCTHMSVYTCTDVHDHVVVRRVLISWNYSYRWLRATVSAENQTPARAAGSHPLGRHLSIQINQLTLTRHPPYTDSSYKLLGKKKPGKPLTLSFIHSANICLNLLDAKHCSRRGTSWNKTNTLPSWSYVAQTLEQGDKQWQRRSVTGDTLKVGRGAVHLRCRHRKGFCL